MFVYKKKLRPEENARPPCDRRFCPYFDYLLSGSFDVWSKQSCTVSRAMETHFATRSHTREPCPHGRDCEHHRRLPWSKILREQEKMEARFHCFVWSHGGPAPTANLGRVVKLRSQPRTDRARARVVAAKSREMYLRSLASFRRALTDVGIKSTGLAGIGRALIQTAVDRMAHPMHEWLGKPLSLQEMVAILEYTHNNSMSSGASSCRYHALRTEAASESRLVLQAMLTSAIWKLHKAEKKNYGGKNHADVFLGHRTLAPETHLHHAQIAALQKQTVLMSEHLARPGQPLIFLPYAHVLIASFSRKVAKRAAGPQGFVTRLLRHPHVACADIGWTSQRARELKQVLFAPPCVVGVHQVACEAKQTRLEAYVMGCPQEKKKAHADGRPVVFRSFSTKPGEQEKRRASYRPPPRRNASCPRTKVRALT